MKLWISGEVDNDIGDAFREVLNIVESEVNIVIEQQYYGTGLISWDIIFIISKTGGQEICKYNKKNKETDIRLVINHDEFKISDLLNQRQLFLHGLLRSISLLRQKEIEDFNYDKLQSDLETLKLCKVI